MNKDRSFLSILIPNMTVFFSSGCIMILEIVAGRLIARHLGSSLYTWTSVIGVVLAGITIGNYLGGHIADRFPAKKTIAVLFGISSIACVGIIVLNNLVGNWMWLQQFNWPMRIFSHVSVVFLAPSIILGAISPIVAKMALDKGLPMGRTVGTIYAWGAAGSIMGTLLTGFYLIAVMGTTAIIWTIGFTLLLMSILYWARLWVLYVWAIIFIALITMGMVSVDWAKTMGTTLKLRERHNPNIIYETESQYNYIAVESLSTRLDMRGFIQDKITQSVIRMDNIKDLRCYYERIYAMITYYFSQGKRKLSTLSIGGGGYVFPRYIEEVWPGSLIDVVEIDPQVTEAAIEAFGLKRDSPIHTISMDARNYVDQLLEKTRSGKKISRYDFIYGDAFNDYWVPYHLVTKEFNDKVAQILKDDGLYILNVIDIFDNGRFLGATINTLQQTFPAVYVLAKPNAKTIVKDSNFVIIGAKRKINIANFLNQKPMKNLWLLDSHDIKAIKEKTCGIVLTDDYSPVENLLAPTVLKTASKRR